MNRVPMPEDRYRWSVRLLGAIEADDGQRVLSSFATRAVAQLLARLALEPERDHPREELIELLWPGVAMSTGRNRLRQALSTLKTQLEGRDKTRPSVLEANRTCVRVVAGAIDSDVRKFNRLVEAGRPEEASKLQRGQFMPGHYDDWVIVERRRVEAMHEALLAIRAPIMPVVVPTGLPNYWTRAFCVDERARGLVERVRAHRLVTIHGPGGSGKTRLAVTLAHRLAKPQDDQDRPRAQAGFDRIAFVPLHDCTSAAQVTSAICLALRVDGGPEPILRILTSLSSRRALLVLDNCEQLDVEAIEVFAHLLSAAPDLHVLVTSRRLLDLDGEAAFALEGLSLPARDIDAVSAAGTSAVALFLDRARAAKESFDPDPENLAAVAELVRLLAGMPLAIELAASRMRALAPIELLQRLRNQAGTPMLDLLARRAAEDSAEWRHASMRHVIAWSWSQLDGPQATMMSRISVLASSARLETLACVAEVRPEVAQTLIEGLQDASLIQCTIANDRTRRYAVLQPVREFAAEQLRPDEARTARRQLRRWLTETCAGAVDCSPSMVMPELPLVHAAITTAPADGAPEEAVRLALVLRPFWDADPLPQSALDALVACLPRIEDPGQCGETHELLSFGHGLTGHVELAIRHAEAAIKLAVDDRRRSVALARWVHAAMYAGRPAADLFEAVRESEALARRCGDDRALANTLRFSCLMECNMNEAFSRAREIAEQAQRLWERVGSRQMANARRLDVAVMTAWSGHDGDALAMMPGIERTALELQDWIGYLHALRQHGRMLNRARSWRRAVEAFRHAVRIGWERHFSFGIAVSLLHLPEALAMTGRAETAAQLRGFAEQNWHRTCGAMSELERREIKRSWRMIRMQLGGPRAEALRTQGSHLGLARAVALALDERTGEPVQGRIPRQTADALQPEAP